MRRGRGFTLVEMIAVIAVLTVMSGSFLHMFAGMYEQLRSVARQADLKADCQRASAVVFRAVAGDPLAVLDADNHGLRFANGSHVYWDAHDLVEVQRDGRRTLIVRDVADFTVLHSKDVWTINLVVRASTRTHGAPVSYRLICDWPRLTDREGGTAR